MHAPRPDRAERARINSDEEERLRFVLDVEKGTWSNQGNLLDPDDDSPVGPRHERVIPYVEDHRNCLILEPTLERLHLGLESLAAGHPHYAHKDVAELRTMLMASLQAALKSAIQVRYQLEESEIAVEPLPGRDDRRLLLSYEAAEGGAGVLRRLVEEPDALPAVARAEHLASLLRLAASEVEHRWLAHMNAGDYRLPSRVQVFIEACKTQPDFYYDGDHQTGVYVDGPPHQYPERQTRDAAQDECLMDQGILVVRFRAEADWEAVLAQYPHIFGKAT